MALVLKNPTAKPVEAAVPETASALCANATTAANTAAWTTEHRFQDFRKQYLCAGSPRDILDSTKRLYNLQSEVARLVPKPVNLQPFAEQARAGILATEDAHLDSTEKLQLGKGARAIAAQISNDVESVRASNRNWGLFSMANGAVGITAAASLIGGTSIAFPVVVGLVGVLSVGMGAYRTYNWLKTRNVPTDIPESIYIPKDLSKHEGTI